jgi:predicted porin
MRKLLLAGVALAGVAAMMPTGAFAQSASTTFPLTTRAGKLDGAAPNSVTVSIGGTMFTAIAFPWGSGNTGPNGTMEPQLLSYIRLYPNFDYAAPGGWHFGVNAELRSTGAAQNVGRNTQSGNGSTSGNFLYWHSAVAYVSSDKFGKFAFGTPNSATDQLGVGTGDDFGTGGFYGEYGWPWAPNFIMSDSYDGDSPKEKIAYYSPNFSGFQLALSYQPSSIGLSNQTTYNGSNPTLLALYNAANPNAQIGQVGGSRNRIEVAGQYAHSFGATSLKLSAGWAGAGHEQPAEGFSNGFQNVSMFTAGAVVGYAGFSLEGSVVTGKMNYATTDSGSPLGPLPNGANNTTAFIVGPGYTSGPFAVGAQYYYVSFDAGDVGGTLNSAGKAAGFALGASYVVGPGVTLEFDAATNNYQVPGLWDGTKNGGIVGLGAYFSW